MWVWRGVGAGTWWKKLIAELEKVSLLLIMRSTFGIYVNHLRPPIDRARLLELIDAFVSPIGALDLIQQRFTPRKSIRSLIS